MGVDNTIVLTVNTKSEWEQTVALFLRALNDWPNDSEDTRGLRYMIVLFEAHISGMPCLRPAHVNILGRGGVLVCI